MRIAIVGSGAMGQLFGARLQLAGNDVVFIDSQQRVLNALNASGITIHTDAETEHVEVIARSAKNQTEPFDLLLIFTKAFHTRKAVEQIRHLIKPKSVGLTLQNGLGTAEILEEAFTADQTLIGITDFPADCPQPSQIVSTTQGSVQLGPFNSNYDLAERIANALSDARLNASVPPDIRIPIWEKIAFNAALNTLSAITGTTVSEISNSPEARIVVKQVIQETKRVADSISVEISTQRVMKTINNAYANHGDHKSSMLVDLEKGHPTEVDYIGGAVVEIGETRQIPTPVLATLCSLLKTLSIPAPRDFAHTYRR